MSLILEALRKSEAERRRGEVPNLHAERAPAVAATRATGTAWPWLALALVAAVTLAWLARGIWSSSSAGAASGPLDPPASGPDASVVVGAREPVAGDRDAATPLLSVDGPRPPTDPASLAGTPAPPRVGANPVAAAGDTATLQPRIEPGRTPIREANADSAEAGVVAPPVVAPPSPRVAAVASPAPAIVAVPTRPAPATTGPGAAGDGNPPLRLSDLSNAERLELPPLKISMHLWDPSPTRRFAIIDGARVNEGDRIGDAVVDEITANAVLLAWRGQQLQIPLR